MMAGARGLQDQRTRKFRASCFSLAKVRGPVPSAYLLGPGLQVDVAAYRIVIEILAHDGTALVGGKRAISSAINVIFTGQKEPGESFHMNDTGATNCVQLGEEEQDAPLMPGGPQHAVVRAYNYTCLTRCIPTTVQCRWIGSGRMWTLLNCCGIYCHCVSTDGHSGRGSALNWRWRQGQTCVVVGS